MYADTGLLFPYFQNLSQELQQLDEYCETHKPNPPMSDLAQSSAMSEYFDLAAEGDLFKAPEPITEEPVMDLDPMTAAISMISCGEDAVPSQGLKPSDSLQHEQLLSDVFYECKKDMLEKKAAIESPLSEILEIKVPALNTDEIQIQESKPFPGSPLPKSVSSGCLSSMEWVQGPAMKPAFINFPGINFCADYGMRRAFSEGDIKALGSGNMHVIQSPSERPIPISNCTSEERREKLSRYWSKKTRRNFGRKIKYACRKALADSQPRIRGRFAKTEEFDTRRQC